MTDELTSGGSPRTGRSLLPWLVALAALVFYGIFVDHWVSYAGLQTTALVTGWDWHPMPISWRQTLQAPLYLVLTSPVRILPVSLQPLLLNLFSAVCAAVTLGLLAASVRLLPHDRTREQRQRENGEYSLLSIPLWFVPPLFAVLVLAFQPAFWRGALMAGTGLLDLLVFALAIYCLLRFRVSQNDNWLLLLAFVYGLGMSNDWAMVGFSLCFAVAVVWIKGASFFNLRFLGRFAACGAAGLLLYLLIPAVTALGPDRANFIDALHAELGAEHFWIRSVPRWLMIVAALPTLVPLLFAGIKWPSFEGEMSAVGTTLTRLMFRVLHIFFLLLALVLFFNFRFSPGATLAAELPSLGFLSFHYIGALCVGYFSGYILLIYGRPLGRGQDSPGSLMRALNPAVVGLCLLLCLAAPGWLLWQNWPAIRAHKNSVLPKYAEEMAAELPSKRTVVMCDDPPELQLLQAEYQREGKANPHILIDTSALPHREYIEYLLEKYPELKKDSAWGGPIPKNLRPLQIIVLIIKLAQQYPVSYLNPSFGYFFENFYLVPKGVTFDLVLCPTNSLLPPPLPAADAQTAKTAWGRMGKAALDTLATDAPRDPGAAWLGTVLSVDLDLYGVQMERAGYLQEAGAAFADAARINTNNYIAQINGLYNAQLAQKKFQPVDSDRLMFKALTHYRNAYGILGLNGPPDDPGLDLVFGETFAVMKLYRQSAILFNRRLQLLPKDIAATLDMARTYVDWGHPTKAYPLLAELRANPAVNQWEVSRVEALARYKEGSFTSAEDVILKAAREGATEDIRDYTLAQFYEAGAEEVTNKVEAGRRYTNSLVYWDKLLALMADPNHSSHRYKAPDILLEKAKVQMRLEQYSAAISTLNRVITLQPENPTAVLNRAVAEVEVNQIPAARDDYVSLRKLVPDQPYISYGGLAALSARAKDVPMEIRYLKLYLSTAPMSLEKQNLQQRLKKLEGH